MKLELTEPSSNYGDVESDYDLLLYVHAGSCMISFYSTSQGMCVLIAWDPHSAVALILAFIIIGLLSLIRTHDTSYKHILHR